MAKRPDALLAIAATLFASYVAAQDMARQTISSEELVWGPPTPLGFRQANVIRDPSRQGLYVQRVRFPAGVKLPPHTHPDERIATVLSGTLHVGYGEQFDESTLRVIHEGGVWTEPAGAAHFAWAKDGEVVVQVVGFGPSAFNRVRDLTK